MISDYLKSKGIVTLYHFTDRSNIKSIIDNGGIYSWQSCQERGICVKRPGGDESSHSIDAYKGLAKYVRLSFTPNHPMMYVARNDGRIYDPIVLKIDLSVVDIPSAMFSDVNAARTNAIIASGITGARNIHFSTVQQQNHFNLTEEEKPFYQAEVLIYDKVPLSYIKNIEIYKPKATTTNTYKPTYTPSSTYTPVNKPSTQYRSGNSVSSPSSDNNFGCIFIVLFFATLLLIAAIVS